MKTELLQENEKILWEGKTENFALLDSSNKTSVMTTWIVCGVLALGTVCGYVPYAVNHGTAGKNIVIAVAVILALLALFALRPITDRKKLLSLEYAVTDAHVLSAGGDTKHSMGVTLETPCRIMTLDGGLQALLIGDTEKIRPAKLRENAITAVKDDKDPARIVGMVFYGIKDAEKAIKAIRTL